MGEAGRDLVGDELLGEDFKAYSLSNISNLLLFEGVGHVSADVLSELHNKNTAVSPVCLGGDVREFVVQAELVSEAEGVSFLQILNDVLHNVVPVAR